MGKLKLFLLAVVTIITCFTHLYRISHTFIFQNDEARDVLIVKKMIDTKKPVLLGPQTSVGNMYLGPLYYYLMLPPLIISQMDPVGPAIMVACFAILTTILLFYLGTKQFGLLGGTVAALFYALNPVMLHYSRSSWNPNLLPFFSLLLLLAWDEKRGRGWILFGFAAGVIFQLHYVALTMVLLVGLAKLQADRTRTHLVAGMLTFFLTTLPFWLFEFRHQFVNSQAFFTFVKEGSPNTDLNSSYIARLLSNGELIIKGIIGSSSISLVPVTPILLLTLALFLLLLLPLIRSTRYLAYLLALSLVLTSIIKSPLHVHYVAFLFPVVALSLGALSALGPRLMRIITLTCLGLIFWQTIPTLRYNLGQIYSIQTTRAQIISDYIVSEAQGRSYNVVSTAGTYATPIEYYLALSPNPPKIEYTNLIFDICDNNPCPLSDATTTLLYSAGPTHPAIAEYLGHPSTLEYKSPRVIEKNESVAYGTWIATLALKP